MHRVLDTFVSFYLAQGRVHIPPGALYGIDCPRYVRFLLAKDGKSMIMEPYDHKEFQSMRVPKCMYESNPTRRQMEIRCMLFCRLLASWLKLDMGKSYRFPGKILCNQQLVVFDLTDVASVHNEIL